MKLETVTKIIVVCMKLHNFIIDSCTSTCFDIPPIMRSNKRKEMPELPFVHFQDGLHDEMYMSRSRNRWRENTAPRDRICKRLSELGFVRIRTAKT